MSSKINRRIVHAIFLACMLLILSNIVAALGVGPSRQYINFEPGQKIDGELMIINDGGDAFKAAMYAQGDIAGYVSIEKPLIDVAASEAIVKAKYTIEFPSNATLTPGEHKIELVVRQFPPENKEGGTVIAASMAVISQIIVKVPYPGKYAEAKLFIGGAETPESEAKFVVGIYNFGTEDIKVAKADIQVVGPTWEEIAKFSTNTLPIKSKEEAKVEAMWKPNVSKGTYHAVATVDYDGQQFKLEQNFDVGTFMIDISDISVKNFRLGDVAKFDIVLYNSWNTEINDVYVEMTVEDSAGKQMTEFKTSVINIPAQKDGKLEAYWYTEGVAPGIYKVKLIVHYAGKLVQKEYDFEVSTNSITKVGAVGQAITAQEIEDVTSRGTIILLIIITLALLIGMNIAWFYKLNKMIKGKQGGGAQ
jgi:hypothetical protein